MTKLTADFIKFIAETILLLAVYAVVFDPTNGIVTNSYLYLSYAEPITLLNHISTAMTTAGYIPGEFTTSFKTSGIPYIINIYEENGNTYAAIDTRLMEEDLINTEFIGLEPVPIVSDCQIREQTIILEEGLEQKVTIKKIIVGDTCEVFIDAKGMSYGFDIYLFPDSVTLQPSEQVVVDVEVSESENAEAGPVTLSASGEPSGVYVSFSTTKARTTFSSKMTITTSSSVQPGTYEIEIRGEGLGIEKTATFYLKIASTSVSATSVSGCDEQCQDQGYASGTCVAGNGGTQPSEPIGNGVNWELWLNPEYHIERQFQLMKSWGFKTVRLTVIDKNNVFPSDNSGNYLGFDVITDAVQWAKNNDLTLIINYFDPTTKDSGPQYVDDVQFWISVWKQIATEFKDENHVVYEVMNEPWFDDGSSGTLERWQNDMQAVVNEIRKIDYDTPIIVDCMYRYDVPDPMIRYGSFESCVNKPISGNNIWYSVNYYESGWQRACENFGLDYNSYEDFKQYMEDNLMWKDAYEKGYTMWVGEWGDMQPPYTFASHMLKLMNEYDVNWNVWWWRYSSADPSTHRNLLADWDGTPNDWGDFIRDNIDTSSTSSEYEFTVDENFENTNIIEYHYDSVYTRDRFDTWTVDHELVYGRGGSGDYVGQVEISTDVSRSGSKSLKAHGDKVAVAFINFEGQIDNPYYGSRYMETKEFYVTYWIYFPSSFSYVEGIDKWTNLGDIVFEQKRDPDTNELLEEFRLTFGLDSNYKFYGNKPIYYYGTRTDQSLTAEHNKYMEKEKWMYVEIYVKRDWTDGYYYVYVDGTKVVDYEGATIYLGEKYWSKSLQLYQDADLRNTVYWDDIKVGVKKDGTTTSTSSTSSFEDKILWEDSFETIDSHYYIGGSNEGTGYYWDYYGWGGLEGDNLGNWDTLGLDNGAEVFRSSEIVRSGQYSYKGVHNRINDVVTHTYIGLGSSGGTGNNMPRYDKIGQMVWDEAYYSYWHYFPEDFKFAEKLPEGQTTLAGTTYPWYTCGGLINYWSGTDKDYDPHASWKMRFSVGVEGQSKSGEYARISANVGNYDVPDETEKNDFNYVDVPVGEWFQLQIYWKVGRYDGAYEYWVNGQSIGRKEGVCTDPRYCGDRYPEGDPQAPPYPTFNLDFYTSDWYPYENAPLPYHVYIDDAVIASEFVPLDYHSGEPYSGGTTPTEPDCDGEIIDDDCPSGQVCCCSGIVTVNQCPSESNYPTDRWDRVWCDMDFSEKLADTPDESSIQFDNNWGISEPIPGYSDYIGFRSGRRINFPTTGTYTFTVGSDDGVRVWIDGQLKLDEWYRRSYATNTFDAYITQGYHNVRIDYYEDWIDARVSFSYVLPISGCNGQCIEQGFASGECISSDIQQTEFEVGADMYSATTTSTFNNNYANRMIDCGLTYVRLEFSPGRISNLRSLVPAVTNKGLKIIGLLFNGAYDPDNHEDFGDWVYDIVSEFKDDVHVWEIWNEPNLDQYFSGKDPTKYAQFLKDGYTNAKSADPNCFVLGVSGVFTHNTAQNFLRGVYNTIGTGYMDALAWHPYCYPYDLDSHPNNPYTDLPEIKAIMEEYGDDNHIWITEMGWPHSGETSVGETLQAQYLVEALEMARDWGWVDTFIIYSWSDSASMSRKMGITASGNPHPSYYAVQDFISTLGTVPSTGTCSGTPIGQDGCSSGQTCCCSGTAPGPPPTSGKPRYGFAIHRPYGQRTLNYLTKERMQYLKNLGFNTITYVVFWSTIENSYYEPQVYHQGNLQNLRTMVDRAKDVGLTPVISWFIDYDSPSGNRAWWSGWATNDYVNMDKGYVNDDWQYNGDYGSSTSDVWETGGRKRYGDFIEDMGELFPDCIHDICKFLYHATSTSAEKNRIWTQTTFPYLLGRLRNSANKEPAVFTPVHQNPVRYQDVYPNCDWWFDDPYGVIFGCGHMTEWNVVDHGSWDYDTSYQDQRFAPLYKFRANFPDVEIMSVEFGGIMMYESERPPQQSRVDHLEYTLENMYNVEAGWMYWCMSWYQGSDNILRNQPNSDSMVLEPVILASLQEYMIT